MFSSHSGNDDRVVMNADGKYAELVSCMIATMIDAYISNEEEKVIEANSDTPREKAELALWGGLLGFGKVAGGARQAIEAVDLFVGRYLLLTTVAYVGIKFVHFKLWDPIPF